MSSLTNDMNHQDFWSEDGAASFLSALEKCMSDTGLDVFSRQYLQMTRHVHTRMVDIARQSDFFVEPEGPERQCFLIINSLLGKVFDFVNSRPRTARDDRRSQASEMTRIRDILLDACDQYPLETGNADLWPGQARRPWNPSSPFSAQGLRALHPRDGSHVPSAPMRAKSQYNHARYIFILERLQGPRTDAAFNSKAEVNKSPSWDSRGPSKSSLGSSRYDSPSRPSVFISDPTTELSHGAEPKSQQDLGRLYLSQNSTTYPLGSSGVFNAEWASPGTRELQSMGFSANQVNQLLLEEQEDSPWIHIDSPQELKALDDDRLLQALEIHKTVCGHSGRKGPQHKDFVTPFIQYDSISRTKLDQLLSETCGLAGIIPTSNGARWRGSVRFENDNSKASIVYGTDMEVPHPGASSGHPSSRIAMMETFVGQWRSITEALEGFFRAVIALQDCGLVCDRFTVIWSRSERERRSSEMLFVEHILFPNVYHLLQALWSGHENGFDAQVVLQQPAWASKVMSGALRCMPSRSSCLYTIPSTDSHFALHMAALATQVLTMGLTLYSRSHVGMSKFGRFGKKVCWAFLGSYKLM